MSSHLEGPAPMVAAVLAALGPDVRVVVTSGSFGKPNPARGKRGRTPSHLRGKARERVAAEPRRAAPERAERRAARAAVAPVEAPRTAVAPEPAGRCPVAVWVPSGVSRFDPEAARRRAFA